MWHTTNPSIPVCLRKAQPCRYCFYSVQKQVLHSAGATRCPDKREVCHSPLPVLNFMFIGAEMWEYSPKTVKISNFGNKFARQRSQVCTIFTKFSDFVRVYRWILSFLCFRGTNNQVISIFPWLGLSSSLFSSLRGRQLLNCLALRPQTVVGAFSLKFQQPLAAKLLIGSKKVRGANMGRTSSITMPSMVGILGHAPAVDEKV